jgi:NAD(P)-dependent dehydrogenase (short-subunit alcohol dehydrogenase family)
MYEGGFVREQSVDVFDRIISSNLRSAYLLTRAVLPRMSAGARIIYISSVTGLKGVKGMAAYSSSKAGLVALAQSVAGEVERDGIGVHLVTPGPVRTDMTDPETNPDSGVRQWTLEPEDVASAVAWLVQLPPRIVVRDIVMRSATTGPFAPKPIGA